MITVILPTYKNPEYLDLCLKSILENSVRDDTRVIVSVDGFPEVSKEVLDKYNNIPKIDFLIHNTNIGMAAAINIAVWNATSQYVLIINDDNVFCKNWDERILRIINKRHKFENEVVLTINQMEPSPSIYDFWIRDMGKTVTTFQYEKFLEEEILTDGEAIDSHAGLFPFVISKKLFMAIGGFDIYYRSPFVVDFDLWSKLELLGKSLIRAKDIHFYHFGSVSTKKSNESKAFNESEHIAAQQFFYKWGFLPMIRECTNNRKIPLSGITNGIDFSVV